MCARGCNQGKFVRWRCKGHARPVQANPRRESLRRKLDEAIHRIREYETSDDGRNMDSVPKVPRANHSKPNAYDSAPNRIVEKIKRITDGSQPNECLILKCRCECDQQRCAKRYY